MGSARVKAHVFLSLLSPSTLQPFGNRKHKTLSATWHATYAAARASLCVTPRYGGKVHEFAVYFHCDSFDTPENRVITSGLTFGFGLLKHLGDPTHQRGVRKTSRTLRMCCATNSPRRSIWKIAPTIVKENEDRC